MVRGWGGGKQNIRLTKLGFFCQSGPTLLVLPSVWESKREDKGHATKPTSTKGGDIRQTLRTRREGTYDKPVDLSSNHTSTKGGDIRQTLRARREGTYDKPLRIKSQFLNSWDSLQADEEGHTTKPTSTKGGDIRQTLTARREGTCDKPVDLSSNPTSMKGGTYDKPYEHEERGHTTNL